MSAVDNLSRPAHPEASRHLVPPSPTYCLRQCPSGFWYLIPYIYEYGFEAMCEQWVKEHSKNFVLDAIMPKPGYAQPVDVRRLTFQTPFIVEG